MVLDYSKWDRIELSDDSDIEVHPNVDKRSFINAKRSQIQHTRAQRKQQIDNCRKEILARNYLLGKWNSVISSVTSNSSKPIETSLNKALSEINQQESEETPSLPPIPPWIKPASYSMFIATRADTFKEEIEAENKAGSSIAMLDKLKEERAKIYKETQSIEKELADLETEDKAKITSADLHEGFSSGHVNKDKPAAAPDKKKTVTQKVQAVEQLNDNRTHQIPGDQSLSSGAEADVEEEADGDEEEGEQIEPTELGKQFAKIKIGDYRKCIQFISDNPGVVAEKETDGLLAYAFNSQMDGKDEYARQCVHQALLLQYCRQLGRDGVSLFFKRITTPNHQAQKVFHDDVMQTYNHIRERAKEIVTEREKTSKGVEQIQLHAVDPNTTINISIPLEGSDDPEVQKAREIFETFPPGLRRALENSSLDEVNKVLGKMSVEEAQEVVGQLSEGVMLSLESQILDATTEDGQKMLQEIEEQEKKSRESGSGHETEKPQHESKGKEPENSLAMEVD